MAHGDTERIRQYILKLIDAEDRDFARKTVEAFGVSKSTVYNYVKRLCLDGVLTKREGAMPPYGIVTERHVFTYSTEEALGEDRVFRADVMPHLAGYEKNVFSAWQYAFTEMMNNAIEHARASEITVTLLKNPLKTRILIYDNGVGIFQNIRSFLLRERGEELSLDECAALLFAGKFTTAEQYHSGEGIFFTSHLMDEFYIFSDGILFSRSNFADVTVKGAEGVGGTLVSMTLANRTKKTTKEVFDRFSDVEAGFIRTHIPIAHVFSFGNPISRSEARRLSALVSDFRDVTLDFSGVSEVGQAFCHELFVVWQRDNPGVVLRIVNASPDVAAMIRRVSGRLSD